MDANEIRRLIINLIRKGSVMKVDLTSNPPTCRVSVGNADDPDGEGLQTNWLPFFALRAGKTREWNPPTEGEQVVLFCPMGDPAQGVVLCGLYSDDAPAPSTSPDTHLRAYPDGAIVEYDHASHSLSANLPAGATVNVTAPGAVNVNTKAATVTADTVTLDADVTVTRTMTVQGAFSFQSGMSGKGGSGKTIKIVGGAEFTDDVMAAGVSVSKHPHQAQGANALTSKPVAEGA